MVRRVVDLDAAYVKALGKKRALSDEKKGINGFVLSKKNEERLAAAARVGESINDVISRILDERDGKKDKE
ncbi:MAG: hypothetical protein LUQ04_03725 [Methanoregula sp.]|nr:hypothetical protein [Methanoregula sp.]